MTTRLLYLVSHPIQYQAPLLRRVTAEPGLSFRVVFEHDTSLGYFDPGFGRPIRWDVPLRQGYDSVLAAETDLAREIAGSDVVWLHGWQGGWMRQALTLARKLGKPVLLRGENTDDAMPDGEGLRGWLKGRYLRWVFSHVTCFLAIGTANRSYYRRRGIAPERIFSVPYAIDNQRFAQQAAAADVEALRRDLGLPSHRPVILYAGKLIPRKHPLTLLRAWKLGHWKGERPALVYVGDGEMLDVLQSQAEDGVVFAGFRNQSELPAFYALADIFVLASEAEPWGLAVNEAMACGTAVVVGANVGCAADLVTRECGTTVSAGDTNALTEALTELLPRADAAGQAAFRRVSSWNFEADVAGLMQALEFLENQPCD